MTRSLPVLVVALAATLLPAGVAAAATRCAPAPCAGDAQYPTVRAAVEAADVADDPDLVLIGEGTFDVSGPGGDGLQVGRATTELRGAGRGRTVLTLQPVTGSSSSVGVVDGAFSALSDVTLRLPSVTTTNNAAAMGADVYDGDLTRVDVDAPGATFGPGDNDGRGDGLLIRGGTLRDVRVDLGGGRDTEGVRFTGASAPIDVDGLEVTAGIRAMVVTFGEFGPASARLLPLRRVRLDSAEPLRVSGGDVRLSDAVVTSRAPRYAGTAAAVSPGYTATAAKLTLDRVTLVGVGIPEEVGALGVASYDADAPATLVARRVAATGFPLTLTEDLFADGTVRTEVDHSALSAGPGAVLRRGTTTGSAASAFTDVRTGDLRLGADLVPGPGSPAIDVGGPALLPADAVDLRGAARPTDGDGDGVSAPDAGAFEAAAPVAAGPPGPAGPGPVVVGGAAPDRLRPGIRRARLSAGRFVPGALRARRGRRPARGTALRFTLTEAATVRLSVQRARPGRRAGRRCLAGRRTGRRCTRWLAAGALPAATRPAGRGRIVVTGRLRGRTLAPGRYRLVVRATDAAGNRSPAVRLPFRLLRP